MAWTTPRTWVTSETVTAALMNTHVRDNLNETCAPTVTTAGDMTYADANKSMGSRLAIGTAGYAMVSTGTAPEWTNHFDYGDYFFSGTGGDGVVGFGITSHTKSAWTEGLLNMKNYGFIGTQGSFGLDLAYNYTRTGGSTYDTLSSATGHNAAGYMFVRSDGFSWGWDTTWGSGSKTAVPTIRMLMDNYRLDLDQGLTYLRLPVKATTGDPTGGSPGEGDLYVNTSDNAVRIYADSAWRDLTDWNMVQLPVKTTTGNPSSPNEGHMYVNTFDNKVSVYADSAWRDLATW